MKTKLIVCTKILALKKAEETFRFWYSVLLETEYMDDVDNRKDFQTALQTIADLQKKRERYNLFFLYLQPN
ncbi:conserved hypothetical protein [Flavobacterium psychrophilum]|uniref:hypothetical protein n=1 Tax=Flavobacterium psychrophilum TaxID=96345 RepID=UPI000618777E|nr:hypothetical protein [Flavobacterium psychrophilum]AKC21326.1 hypothetical protein IY37_03990 [Flavobacterium psychrophilum]SNB30352.1 conserved hypothetical protein [Flavobacterium psychrophilum]